MAETVVKLRAAVYIDWGRAGVGTGYGLDQFCFWRHRTILTKED